MADNKIETELLSQIKEVLLTFPKYWEEDILLRNKVAEDLRSYNQELIKALLSTKLVKDTYSITLDTTTIFKIEDFISMLRYKNYWENSYTKYTNEIGLTSKGKYLNYNTDVVLDFPHKDCIVEGGMIKEDLGKKEIYYHNILAKEEIDTLLSPKVLKDIKKYDKNGYQRINKINSKDNLIIKGNNLIALNVLKDRYEGEVDLIFIDPPYNTGGDSFQYNDKFSHSTWLTFMKNRLVVAKDLLSSNGAIFITLDTVESAHAKLLCDDIFGRKNFVTTIQWKHSDNSNNNALVFSEDYNSILVYSKSSGWKPNFLNDINKRTHFKNPDDNPRGAWFDGNPVNNPGLRPNLQFNLTAPNGNIINHPPNGWRWSKETMKEKFSTGELRYSDDQTRVIRRTYLNEMEGLPPSNLWTNLKQTGHTRGAKYEQKKLFPSVGSTELFSTPKPELLLKYILEIASDKNDLVLDFFMGSATTQAVAHKMNRQYIGVEQMDYINTVSVPRLQKVIEGEQGGISKDVDWEGGGSFVYAELSSLNNEYVKAIQISKNEEDLEKVLFTMKERAYLNFKVDIEKITSKNEGYISLSLEQKKEILIQVLDMNQLYLSYSEIEDEQYNISEDVKEFNHSFYQKEGEDYE